MFESNESYNYRHPWDSTNLDILADHGKEQSFTKVLENIIVMATKKEITLDV